MIIDDRKILTTCLYTHSPFKLCHFFIPLLKICLITCLFFPAEVHRGCVLQGIFLPYEPVVQFFPEILNEI